MSVRAAPAPDPYRLLFPFGLAYALAGAGVWPLAAFGAIGDPGPLHRALMMQGFEMSFVMGFMLTAMAGLTHGPRCRPAELVSAVIGITAYGFAALTGRPALAAAAFVGCLLVLVAALAPRLARARVAPAEEMWFVGFGLALGVAGGVLQLGAARGLWSDPAPRFAERLVSLGMMLSLVLGVGGLLVPVFAGMRDPLKIAGIAGPHQGPGRRVFYLGLIALFAIAFALEALAHPRAGAGLRAAAATALLLPVWKLGRLPGRRALHAFALWASGWLMFAGLWLAAIAPGLTLAAYHAVFIGGYGLLTLGIGTRVITAHGRHPLELERRVLTPAVLAAVLLALAARVIAEVVPGPSRAWLGASGALWIAGWLAWGIRALPALAIVRGESDEARAPDGATRVSAPPSPPP